MKYRTILLVTCLLVLFNFTGSAQEPNSKYDKKLADSLKSDDYGMRLYYLVLLKTGSNTGAGKATTDSLFRGHMQNIGMLVQQGKLVLAGPIKKNDRHLRGIFILNATSMEEASALLETDPAIKHKLLDVEIYGWYGSAALPMYLPYHQKVEKNKM